MVTAQPESLRQQPSFLLARAAAIARRASGEALAEADLDPLDPAEVGQLTAILTRLLGAHDPAHWASAVTAPQLPSALQGRFSPLRFDPGHRLSDSDVETLLEAARWAPSAGNSQPWSFHLRRREEEGHGLLVEHLAPSSRRWAPAASALVVNVAHREVDDSGMLYSEFADYDLGQAVAHMTIQAHAMGLYCRQFRAFDLEGLENQLGVAPGWHILTMTAIGVPLPDDTSPPARDRRSVADLRTAGMSPAPASNGEVPGETTSRSG